MTDIPIPPEVLEAAENAYCEAWDQDEPALLAALQAALAAWPGMQHMEHGLTTALILPLPQENTDDK